MDVMTTGPVNSNSRKIRKFFKQLAVSSLQNLLSLIILAHETYVVSRCHVQVVGGGLKFERILVISEKLIYSSVLTRNIRIESNKVQIKITAI